MFGLLGGGVSIRQVTGRLFHTPEGQLMISALFGFALAIMFQRTCDGAACIVLRAPPAAEIDGRVFRNGAGETSACYTYTPKVVPCASKSTD